jgi:raffinose/stachyose/melibiose transport system substrate-binding protein
MIRPVVRTLRLLPAVVLLALAVTAGTADSAGVNTVTLNLAAATTSQPGYAALIANFERAYPNITVNAGYGCANQGGAVELTELAAGNGPDLLCDFPGCGMTPAVCDLATQGDLAPLVHEPWTKRSRSLPLVTSLTKHGDVLYAFEPDVDPYGVFTNDTLFAKLGLSVPQTFPQLLTLCRHARADDTTAFLLSGKSGLNVSWLIDALAVSTVYAQNDRWTAELKAGKVTFDGTPGWHQALQEFIEMNNAGCLQAGMVGDGASDTEFGLGQGLMYGFISAGSGTIAAEDPQFTVSFHPFPGGTKPNGTRTFINLSPALSVNAHASAANRAAAHEFVDFVARPAQDAVYAATKGSLTQYQFLKDEVPASMSTFAPVLAGKAYVINPAQTWWNPSVNNVLEQDCIGLISGQESIDDVLNAMDAAWRQGPG